MPTTRPDRNVGTPGSTHRSTAPASCTGTTCSLWVRNMTWSTRTSCAAWASGISTTVGEPRRYGPSWPRSSPPPHYGSRWAVCWRPVQMPPRGAQAGPMSSFAALTTLCGTSRGTARGATRSRSVGTSQQIRAWRLGVPIESMSSCAALTTRCGTNGATAARIGPAGRLRVAVSPVVRMWPRGVPGGSMCSSEAPTTRCGTSSGRAPGAGWESLGGVLTSDPTAVSWGPNRLDVFARGSDNAMWHKFYDGSRWSGWASLGGSLTSAPDASSCAAGHLDVFTTGANAGLYPLGFNGSWGSWQSLGGQLTSDAGAACLTGTSTVDLCGRGLDNALWQTTVPAS